MMDIISLPGALHVNPSDHVLVFDYRTSKELTRRQIILHHNVFSFLQEGEKGVVADNSSITINNSHFMIMKAGHCLMTEKFTTTNHYRSVLLFFSTEILLKLVRKIGTRKQDKSHHASVFSCAYDDFIRRFVTSLVDINRLTGSVRQSLLEVKLEEILLYLSDRHGVDFLYTMTAGSDDVAQEFMRTVESNQFNKLTLKELAFLCNMSVSSFKREFEKHYAESPIKWFQRKRLEYAQRLLQQEQKSASEIYQQVGYDNLSSFIQAYKARYGVTPGHA